METDSDYDDGSAADAVGDDTGTRPDAEGYDEDVGDAIHNDHVNYDSDDGLYYFDAEESEFNAESKFPPSLAEYYDRMSKTTHPRVVVDEGRKVAFQQCMKEVDYVRGIIGFGEEGEDALFARLFGEESELFVASFKKIGVDYAEFVAFIATFFLECRLRTTLSRLVDDRDINTDRYMSYKRYAAIWKQIDSQGKGQNFTKRFWEMLEGALNDTLHDLFVPKNDEFVMRLAHDDDKHWYNETKKITNRALGEETKHKRARHVKDNAIGFVADVTVNVASGFPVNVRYRRTGEGSATAFKEVSRFVFKFSDENSAPNLTGKVEIAADRGYWNTDTLVFCVGRLGAGVVGTIKRGLKWFPFTWGEKKQSSPQRGVQTQQYVPAQGQPRIFQRTARHNVGKKHNKDHQLTATALRNGHSKTVSMTLTTDPDLDNCVDLVSSSTKDYRKYHKTNKSRRERTMNGFELVAGEDPLDAESESAMDVDDDSDGREYHWECINEQCKILTMGQRDQSWFTMRMFSLTSSIMGRVVRARSPNIDVEDDRRSDYERVLGYLGQVHLLPDGPVQGGDEEGEDESNADSTNVGEEGSADHMSISNETVLELISGEEHPREIVEDDGELLGTTHIYRLSALPESDT